MHADKLRWDARYREAPATGTAVPAPFLLSHRDRLPPGRALDLACGLGRNALYLAAEGYVVKAVDISQVALEQARASARSLSVVVEWVEADLETFPIEPGGWELITCSLFHDPRVLDAAIRGLSPGGVLLYEALLQKEESPGASPGGFSASSYRITPNFLLELALKSGLRVLAYEERGGSPSAVASILAQRPPRAG